MKNLYAITYDNKKWEKNKSDGILFFYISNEEEMLNYILNGLHYIEQKDTSFYKKSPFKTYEELENFCKKYFKETKDIYPTINKSHKFFEDSFKEEFYWYKLLKENLSENEIKMMKDLLFHFTYGL